MKVLVAMSGGVDSSVAASLLLDAGHDVTGVTLKLWGGESDSGCCSVADVEDARRVAAQLGIAHYVFNFGDDFARGVVDPYVSAHAQAETPNPCVECNRTIKFGRLLERAVTMGFDALATGHHARVEGGRGDRRLLRGVDGAKDQSYVLFMLGQAELDATLLPVGHLTKTEVRRRASRLELRTAAKPESMDVCFIRRGGRRGFLAERGVLSPGSIVDVDHGPVGIHHGAEGFTVGQRRGLDVALGRRRYVVDVDAASSTVTIGARRDLIRHRQPIREVGFVRSAACELEALEFQTRAHGEVAPGRLVGDHVLWHEPQPRVAPGQVIAFYRGEELVGGGVAS